MQEVHDLSVALYELEGLSRDHDLVISVELFGELE